MRTGFLRRSSVLFFGLIVVSAVHCETLYGWCRNRGANIHFSNVFDVDKSQKEEAEAAFAKRVGEESQCSFWQSRSEAEQELNQQIRASESWLGHPTAVIKSVDRVTFAPPARYSSTPSQPTLDPGSGSSVSVPSKAAVLKSGSNAPSKCLAHRERTEGSAYDSFVNRCGYKVNYTFCWMPARTAAVFACQGNHYGSDGVGPNDTHIVPPETPRSGERHLYWVECKDPETPATPQWTNSKLVFAGCR